MRFDEMLCDESAQSTEGQGEVDFVVEQGAFGRLCEVMIVIEVGEAAGLLAVLKEMGRIEGGDEGVVFLRKAEEPARPVDAAACGDVAGGGCGFEAEGLLH